MYYSFIFAAAKIMTIFLWHWLSHAFQDYHTDYIMHSDAASLHITGIFCQLCTKIIKNLSKTHSRQSMVTKSFHLWHCTLHTVVWLLHQVFFSALQKQRCSDRSHNLDHCRLWLLTSHSLQLYMILHCLPKGLLFLY